MLSYAISLQLVPLSDEFALTEALRTVIIEIPSNTQLSHILISRILPRLHAQVCPLNTQLT
jgi:hypothetical protein